jgi:hypothetical protein
MQSRLNSSTRNVELVAEKYITNPSGSGYIIVSPTELISTSSRRVVTGYVFEGKCTTLAEIEDLFYSSYANISGRFLGTKQSFVKWFTSSKEDYTRSNLQIIAGNSVEIPKTVYVTETLTTQSLTGNITGSIQFVNKLYTGDLGSISNSVEYVYNEVDFGISMSTSESPVRFYGNLTKEDIIGPEGVVTFGQSTIPLLSGSFQSESYLDMYVRGEVTGSFKGNIIGASGSIMWCEEDRSSCYSVDFPGDRTDDFLLPTGKYITGSIRGRMRGYFTGSVNFLECSGSISTDTFTGNILGHLSGSLQGSSLNIYSCKGTISGPINLSTNTNSEDSIGTQQLDPAIIINPQLTYLTTVVDKVSNLAIEMPFYNTVTIDTCLVFPVNSQISYTDDIESLRAAGVGNEQPLSFMVGATYVSRSIEGHPDQYEEYVYTEKPVGLELGVREYPKVGDIAYYSDKRLVSKKIYIPENKVCYTLDSNGQIKSIDKLSKKQNTVVIAEQKSDVIPTSVTESAID